MILNFGKWKHESTFTRAKFIRQKCYLEEIIENNEIKNINENQKNEDENIDINKREKIDDEIKITCAGLPSRCYKFVTWENFKTGFKCGGKLTYKHVKGGVILVETEFSIKEDNIKKQIEKFKK